MPGTSRREARAHGRNLMGSTVSKQLRRCLVVLLVQYGCSGADCVSGPLCVSGLPILHTCGHRKLHTWRFDLAGGRVGM